MKHFILFCAICLLTFISKAQDFLNGDFEINTAVTDQINLSNSSFNNFMPNSTAFGTFENLDIITSNTYCGVALSGNWFIALTGGGTDAITMELSEPLVAGEEYTISFWDRGCDAFSYGPLSVNIGVSSSPIAVPFFSGSTLTVCVGLLSTGVAATDFVISALAAAAA